MPERTVFFRLDDVADRSPQAEAMIERFVSRRVPLHCAVIPGKATGEMARWLLAARERFGGVEIGQHGWMHLDHGGGGEFGGARTLADQEGDLAKGREAMDRLFGGEWLPVFTPPWGRWNGATVEALARGGYRILSAGTGRGRGHRMLAPAARALGRRELLGAPVSYHPGSVAGGRGLVEISVSVDLAEGYPAPRPKDPASVVEEASRAFSATICVGFLLHPPAEGDAGGGVAALDGIFDRLDGFSSETLPLSGCGPVDPPRG